MSQSLAQLYIHLVFSTKDRASVIAAEHRDRLHACLAGTLNAIKCPAIIAVPPFQGLLVRVADPGLRSLRELALGFVVLPFQGFG